MTGTRPFLISAIASGQGKTTATAALARRLLQAGLRVRLFKVGADFLDALILERAAREPVHALDLWMVGEQECARLLEEASHTADVVLIEGAMGLYDGTPSAADLARRFDLPVLAVIDVRAMAQTVGAVAAGLRDFGGIRLAGVIANAVAGPGHEAMIREALAGVPLVASLGLQESALPERHLGLQPPAESPDIEARLDALGAALNLDTGAWSRIAAAAAVSDARDRHPAEASAQPAAGPRASSSGGLAGRRVAIARDTAFAFLYHANTQCLERLGAELVYFSPLANQPVPSGVQAIFLPGGYPELHAAELSRAARFHASMRAAHAAGLPILAECGGMMVLAESIRDLEQRDWPMAGLIPGGTRMQPRFAGLGLQFWPTRHGEIRGHTFHYSTLDTPLVPAARTTAYPRLSAGEPVYRLGSLTASYFHAYFPSSPRAISALLEGAAP